MVTFPYRGSDFGPVRFLLLVCRLSLFLYTLNIICKFFVTFFSATIDGTNLIFYHKLHIQCRYAILWEAYNVGMPYYGKLFQTRQVPTYCLLTFEERGYHRWAVAHSSSCLLFFFWLVLVSQWQYICLQDHIIYFVNCNMLSRESLLLINVYVLYLLYVSTIAPRYCSGEWY